MKSQLCLAACLLLLDLIASPVESRIFPTAELHSKRPSDTMLEMIIGTIYGREAPNPPPSPTKKQSGKGVSTDDSTCEDLVILEESTSLDNNTLNQKKRCQRVVINRSPPTAVEILERNNRLSPPPPPRGATPSGHLTPLTHCFPGRSCGGLMSDILNNLSSL